MQKHITNADCPLSSTQTRVLFGCFGRRAALGKIKGIKIIRKLQHNSRLLSDTFFVSIAHFSAVVNEKVNVFHKVFSHVLLADKKTAHGFHRGLLCLFRYAGRIRLYSSTSAL